jgi:hypothetical protein
MRNANLNAKRIGSGGVRVIYLHLHLLSAFAEEYRSPLRVGIQTRTHR